MKYGFSHENLPVAITAKGTLILTENFHYIDKRGIKHEVNKGFEFDGASIPKFFWRLITHPFSSKIVRPAMLHDFGYRFGNRTKDKEDSMFKEMMEFENRLPIWKQKAIYQAVDKFGQSSWDKNRANDENLATYN